MLQLRNAQAVRVGQSVHEQLVYENGHGNLAPAGLVIERTDQDTTDGWRVVAAPPVDSSPHRIEVGAGNARGFAGSV